MISSIGGSCYQAASMSSSVQGRGQGMNGKDPAAMAEEMFKKTDTSGDGSIDKSELEAMLKNAPKRPDDASGTNSTPSVDDLFKELDADGDGKISETENTEGMEKMHAKMGPPPGPPPDMNSSASSSSSSATGSTEESDIQAMLEQLFKQRSESNTQYYDNYTSGSLLNVSA